jgi:glutamine amidotransferase-like uncharacterized protein
VKLYFVNERSGKRYDIVHFDKDAGEVRLKGPHAEFTEKFDKDRFLKMGYVLKQEEPSA